MAEHPLASISLRNYRAFSPHGVILPLNHQFTGLLGVNNSGKSSLLRALHELRPIFRWVGSLSAGDSKLLNPLGAQLSSFGVGLALRGGERIAPVQRPGALPIVTLTLSPDDSLPRASEPVEFSVEIRTAASGNFRIKTADGTEHAGCDSAVGSRMDGPTGVEAAIALTKGAETRLVRWAPIAEACQMAADTMYIGAFRNALNAGGGQDYDLIVGRNFVESFAEYKSGDQPSSNEAISEMCVELSTIFGMNTLDVNPTPDRQRLTFIVDGRSYRASEMGAGITQFVVTAANVLVRKPRILLIDEPELNLHASLQLRFLTLLGNYASHVLFATHSLGLARSAADIVLVTDRDAFGTITLNPYEAAPTLASVVGELGYGGRHDPSYGAVLLVEGVQDVRVFQQFLATYGVRGAVVVVPLGGDDLASAGKALELGELRRLADHVFAIVDSERTAEGADPAERRVAFARTCASLGITAHVTARRMTENYFLEADIKQMYGNSYPVFGPFEVPSPPWSKERNWRLARGLAKDDLNATDLGPVLSEIANLVGGQ